MEEGEHNVVEPVAFVESNIAVKLRLNSARATKFAELMEEGEHNVVELVAFVDPIQIRAVANRVDNRHNHFVTRRHIAIAVTGGGETVV